MNYNAEKYAALLVSIAANIDTVNKLTKEILSSSDNRDFLYDVHQMTDMSLASLHTHLTKEVEKLVETMDLVKDGLYVQDVELIKGKGNWRHIADNEPTINAIKALRKHIGEISALEARTVVKGYKAGVLK
ncbi:hypothetical protein fnug_20 [Pseudomonas phage fnug]|uniref:Uncharacterized protein n=3 Tax=Phikzvirus TaxID=680115 RepID=A0AAE7SDZ6_9CAUD|nr:hypothetical protein [Pseudomonas aeruginosa]ANM44778.1 hypothetical protein KTN4_020 [Pseudomonas phage KTN4]QJB22663.1 hypothetical protein fnug_20 [Pseudomonas phage fnug]QOV07874.1 hypothetical protein [Pseudomonas phage vB_PaeM_kmuB]QXN68694.1 hypothetical protein [Pseudomonas phage PA7]QYV98975.1 hypothetical protein [Pseudomonas phage T2P]QYV99184.1 hypothetical protein [Pseudomonas phage U1B]QYV99639.1 hypothetical protein [Pseudomonas phage U5]USL86606.1 hypothetical protein CDG